MGGLWFQGLVLLCLILALIEWVKLCRNDVVSTPEQVSWLIIGSVYIGISSVSMSLLRGDSETERTTILFILLCVWVADTGAYISGSTIGGPKLAPRISPKKTWAGLIGALVGAGVVGAIFSRWLPDWGWVELAAAGVFLGGVAQTGDLVESLAKRRFGVKDSGALIPGHGGILDRIDGLLAACLAAALGTGVLVDGVRSWF